MVWCYISLNINRKKNKLQWGRVIISNIKDIVEPIFVAVIGGTSSGKSTIAELIAMIIGQEQSSKILVTRHFPDVDLTLTSNYDPTMEYVTIVEADRFYRDITAVEAIQGAIRNWDDPNLIDFIALYNSLIRLSLGETVPMPYYRKNPGDLIWDHEKATPLEPAPVIIVESFLLHAVEKGLENSYFFREDVNVVTHDGPEPKKFRTGDPVIPPTLLNKDGTLSLAGDEDSSSSNYISDTRKFIQESLFGENGLFKGHKYFVHCDESEALIRRLLRDYVKQGREFGETFGYLPDIQKTFQDIILREYQDNRAEWQLINNTIFTADTAAQIGDIAKSLTEEAGIQTFRRFDDFRQRAGDVLATYSLYMEFLVKSYIEANPVKLSKFIGGYTEFREGFNLCIPNLPAGASIEQYQTHLENFEEYIQKQLIFQTLPPFLPEWLVQDKNTVKLMQDYRG